MIVEATLDVNRRRSESPPNSRQVIVISDRSGREGVPIGADKDRLIIAVSDMTSEDYASE